MKSDLNHQRNARGLTEDLRAARALIDTPEKWAKGMNDGYSSPDPPCYCVLSALRDAVPQRGFERHDRAYQALQEVLPERFQRKVSYFNDDPRTTHADVLALFDRAISNSEASDAR